MICVRAESPRRRGLRAEGCHRPGLVRLPKGICPGPCKTNRGLLHPSRLHDPSGRKGVWADHGHGWGKRGEAPDSRGEAALGPSESGGVGRALPGRFLGMTGPGCPRFPRWGSRSLDRELKEISCGEGKLNRGRKAGGAQRFRDGSGRGKCATPLDPCPSTSTEAPVCGGCGGTCSKRAGPRARRLHKVLWTSESHRA